MKWCVWFVWVWIVLGAVSNANASFLIRGGTGSDGWGLPPVENTAGRSLMPSFVVGSLENPSYYMITFERVEITTADANDPNKVYEVWDGFGGILWVDDALGLIDPHDPNPLTEAPWLYSPETNPVRAMRTWCIVHTSEESMRLHPTLGDPNLSEELKLVVSAAIPVDAGQKQLYYVRYHWPRRHLKPGVYWRGLLTQTTGAACGWSESGIHLNESMLLTSSSPGQIQNYSADRVKYPTASAAVDVYGYVRGKPMLIRNAIGDLNLDPNVPAESREMPFEYSTRGDIIADLTEACGVGLDLKLPERITVVRFRWIETYPVLLPGERKFTVFVDDAGRSAQDRFWADPFNGNCGQYSLKGGSVQQIGVFHYEQWDGEIFTLPLSLGEQTLALSLAADNYVISPYYALMESGGIFAYRGSSAWATVPDLYYYLPAWPNGNPWYWSDVWDDVRFPGRACFDIWAEVIPSYGPAELAKLSANWQRSDAGPDNDWLNNTDLNRDGRVDHEDFLILKTDWTAVEPPMEPRNGSP